ncbi:hypothetical protein KUTeg_014616 [Tegillarca granosa]|uniref:Transcriptional coactivator p15 (PC4) C-terminal domain-containing protein n=1 Tax=Tegillarca granosa TaxID=220873 RepID=A0ABQ9ERJ5_TEGGR|nr:hypothetical protein KUTeg_014616 [Tegillarca granosa]
MSSVRCNIELGNSRFVQATEWGNSPRIDVREWNIRNGERLPTKKGISLPLHCFKILSESLDLVDNALKNKEELKLHLGRNIYCVVSPTSPCVNIRKFWKPDGENQSCHGENN